MAALTGARDTRQMSDGPIPNLLFVPVEANVQVWPGSLVVRDAAGYARPGRVAVGDIALGRMEPTDGTGSIYSGNNVGGSAGAVSIFVRQGVFPWDNSAGGDAITQQNVGQVCYIVDDHTVALTDGNGTRSIAGIIQLVDSSGVWVLTGLINRPLGQTNDPSAGLETELTFVFDLADISATDIVAKFQPGFAGRITKFQAVVMKPATTASKLATITPQINAALGADVAVTGGGLALTSANMTPIGACVQSAAITGANTFAAGDGISLLASAVTAFVEGRVALILTLAS